MASEIDPTKPTDSVLYTGDLRANFSAAKSEIEALQAPLAFKVARGTAPASRSLASGGGTITLSSPRFDVTGTAASSFDLTIANGTVVGETVEIHVGSVTLGANTVRLMDAAGSPNIVVGSVRANRVYTVMWDGSSWIRSGTAVRNADPAAMTDLDFSVVNDTTPELGGTLDGNGNAIVDYTQPHLAAVSGPLTQAAHGGRPVLITGTVTVPITNGFVCHIKNRSGSNQTVQPSGGDLIHEGTTKSSISLPTNRSVVVEGDGSDVWVYGALTASGSGGSRHEIMDEGVVLPARTYLRLTGAGVVASDDGANDRTNVTIDAASGTQTVDLKLTFNATGDGVADDGPELAAALTSIMASGRTLFVPKGTYLATTWTPLAITGPIRIRMEAGAVIKIPGTTQFFASGPTAFFDFDIEGGEIDMDTGGRIAEWRGHSAGTSVLPLLRLVGVTIRNVINTTTPTEASAKDFDMWDSTFDRMLIDRIEVHRCHFIGGTIAMELWGVRTGAVTDTRFSNQTYLGCSINRGTNALGTLHEADSGRVLFIGNHFTDIVNSAASTDTHGLMLFGIGYSIVGCRFEHIQSSANNGNCEGVYTKGHDIAINACTFHNAGSSRGFISMKGTDFLKAVPFQDHPEGYNISITGCTFRCTDAYITSGPAFAMAIHFEVVNVLVSGCSFYNFGLSQTFTCDSEEFVDGGIVGIFNNNFIDCGFGSDTQVLSLSFKGTKVYLRVEGNTFQYFTRIGGRIIYLENATCNAAIKRNTIIGNAGTPATKGIWLRSTGASMLASADVTDNRFLNCTAGVEISGGSGALPVVIHGRNRRLDTGQPQEAITSTVTNNIAD